MRKANTAVVLSILGLAACAERELWPVERLDAKTAVNVTIMAEPWVYARDVPLLAANSRDYLNVGIVETNRSGTRAYWLGVVSWSTIDRGSIAEPAATGGPVKLRLSWAANDLELSAVAAGRSAVGLSEPAFVDPAASFTESWYRLSMSQLAQLGDGAPMTVLLVDDQGQSPTYWQWRVNPAAMSAFRKATGL